jgi:predicted CXXCH cytochrome family protein
MAYTKFRIVTGLLTIAAVCLITLYGGISHATVVGTPHDLSAGGYSIQFMTTEVCVFCHTPHGGNTELSQSTYWNSTGYNNTSNNGSFLLWNRALANLPSSGYATYQSSTLDVNTGQVRAYSLMCMSCHDGVSALNVMTNPPNESASFWFGTDPYNHPVNGGAPDYGLTRFPFPGSTEYRIVDKCVDCGMNVGDMDLSGSNSTINLANDHPVSFDYLGTHPDVTAGGLKDPSTIDSTLRLFPNPSSGTLTSVECSTCHNPHEWGAGPQKPFLVMSNDGSALCLACHIK